MVLLRLFRSFSYLYKSHFKEQIRLGGVLTKKVKKKMGANTSRGMLQTQLTEYLELTYLNKSEIMSLFKKFKERKDHVDKINGRAGDKVGILESRIDFVHISDILPQIKCNPFYDRICYVFSSQKDGRFSFEDLLDFCSVMSENCPHNVKALWAFRIFDITDDNALDEVDFKEIIDLLTDRQITDKHKIMENLLVAMDIEQNGSIGPLEFEHAIGKMSDFGNSFTFRL